MSTLDQLPGRGHLLHAILVELDLLATRLRPGEPSSDEVASALARATDRLETWSEEIDEDTDEQTGIACAATQVARLRSELASEESGLATIRAQAEQHQQRVGSLDDQLEAAHDEAARLEATLDAEHVEDEPLCSEERVLSDQERALYAEMSRLSARSEAEYLGRLEALRRETEDLAGGDRVLLDAAEQLLGISERLAHLIPGLAAPGIARATAELEWLLEAIEQASVAAEERFDEAADMLATVSAEAGRHEWARGEQSGRARWREILDRLGVPLELESCALQEDASRMDADAWLSLDDRETAEAEWIAGEIGGRTTLLQLCGDWHRQQTAAVGAAAALLADAEGDLR